MYGDNIYHFDESKKQWLQENSHHSKENGEINTDNLKKDLSGNNVLISDQYYYFGSDSINIPRNWKPHFEVGIGHRFVNNRIAKLLINWLSNHYEQGYHSDPKLFRDFQRYDGVS